MLVRNETSSELLLQLAGSIKTPALVYDESKLEDLLDLGLVARREAGCRLLYAVKATALPGVLQHLAPRIDGFATSSLFESRFVRDLFPDREIHFTMPGLRPYEVSELSALCEFISFNSRTQAERHSAELCRGSSMGIRINTRVSTVPDQRYDPCRHKSKLGVPIEEVPSTLASVPGIIEGLHIHTNADSTDFGELLANVQVLVNGMPEAVELKWVNLGGGYLFEDVSLEPLIQAVELVRRKFGVEVFLEPGAGLVQSAGFLMGRVLDIFDVDGGRVVVIDATVGHMPEVLEFGFQPDVVGQREEGPFEYTVVGSSCLAGDVFGTYRFGEPLEIGGTVIFRDAGAYTLAKAHLFNGINLPEVGFLGVDGQYRACRTFDYSDFTRYWMTNV